MIFSLLIIILIHILVISKLIFFPYPELFIYPYLTNHGLKPYQQILDQHFPGLMFLPINLNNLGMTTPEVARVWLIMTVVFTQILLFFVSRQILKSDKKALIVNLLYLVWQPFFEGWVLWIDSFLPLILLPAFYTLYQRRFLFCSLLLGIGIVFKQTLIPLSLLVLIYTFWQTRKIKLTMMLLFGLLLPIALMVLYLTSIGVLKDFWYWTIVFNLTTFAKFGTSIPSSVGFVTRVVLVYSLSILALFNKDKRLVQILLIFLAGSLIGVFDRADFVHFQPSLPFALLATVYGLGRLGDLGKIRVIGIGYMPIMIWWLIIFYQGHLSNKVFFFDETTKAVTSKIEQYTKPGEKIFIFGAVPHLYQMSNTLPAGDIFVFQFPWFLKVSESRILKGIERDKPKIIVSDKTVKIEGQAITDYAREINEYIERNYQRIDNIGNTEILKRKS